MALETLLAILSGLVLAFLWSFDEIAGVGFAVRVVEAGRPELGASPKPADEQSGGWASRKFV